MMIPDNQPVWLPVMMILLTTLPAMAQRSAESAFATDGLEVVIADGRELVVLPSKGSVSDAGVSEAVRSTLGAPAAPGGFFASSVETATRRIYVVEFDGETYRAATPLDGSRSRIVFDPARRAFAPLLPSIRVELNSGVQLDAVSEALGATGVTVFESLGFAIVDLPAELHPAEAAARVRGLPGQPEATVRLRRPRIEWR